MNENKNGGAGEAIYVLFIFFVILILLLYKFGNNQATVANFDLDQGNINSSILDEPVASGSENYIYNKYLKQIYDLQSTTIEGGQSSPLVDDIVNNYQKELDIQTTIPEQNIFLKNVSDQFNKKYYAQNFEIIFENLKSKDGTTEGQILVSQMTEDNKLLLLSPYDKEKILRIADEYDNFAEKISNLSTPTSFEKISTEIALSAKNIAYILRRITAETDEKVYLLWISKYAENMSVIITDRYALQNF